MVRKMLFAAVMGTLVLSASACNTVKGAGRDIQSVGQAGSDAIHRR
ncbi:entericidin A/B family lipoprotein [Novosphingobium sp. KCTC 2891]|nr:entericidin A/B family lipoprotein [Novosphingobium sp. KCTC 2891]MCW1383457.1 entericidin A/B family lipoprotein [Novosphingobium sp. KCTC 2891]